MTRPIIRRTAALSVTVLLLFLASLSCVSTTVQAVWKDKKYTGKPFKKIVVVALFKRLQSRQSFENDIAVSLINSGTDAVMSLNLMSPDQKYNYAACEKLFNKNGIDGILILRTVGIDKKQKRVMAENYVVPDVSINDYYWNYYNFYSIAYRNVYSPAYMVETDYLHIEANLYANANDRLVFSMQTTTKEPYITEDGITEPVKEARVFTRLIMKKLKANQLIK